MASAFPTEVFVLDAERLVLARFERKGRLPLVVSSRQYRFPEAPFTENGMTPSLEKAEVLIETIRRAEREAGGIDRASLLLPDSWFRMNLLDLPIEADRGTSPVELIRWAVKKTLPIRPEDVRFAWTPLQKTATATQILAIGAMESTLAALEGAFRQADITLVLIEPLGLNIWNAIASRVTDATAERLFFFLGDDEFTTGVFKGPIPVFLRSRNLSAARSIQQEILLSASYMKSRLEWKTPAECWVSGNRIDEALLQTIGSEFEAPVHRTRLAEFADPGSETHAALDVELTGCTGVFTA